MHYSRWRNSGTLTTSRVVEKHKLKDTPEYQLWGDVKSRTTNPNVGCYPRYGGRGIKIHEPWRRSFLTFYHDLLTEIGPRPNSSYSLDRKDNDGDYEPGNIRWATRIEQTNNTRANKLITINSRTQTLAQWARERGLAYKTVWMRLHSGWSPERALEME